MVMRSRSMNIWRGHQTYSRTVPASAIGPHGWDPIAEYSGGHVWR